MILTIFIFFLLFISVALVIIAQSIQFLIPIVIILIFYIVGLIVYRYKRFGISEFRIFIPQKEPVKFSDMILFMLGKIPGYRRIIQNKKMYADMIVIDESGIYLLKMLKIQGVVTGNREEEFAYNCIKVNTTKTIPNPFYLLDKDVEQLKTIYNDVTFSTILVTNNTCSIQEANVSKKETILLQDFYYTMKHQFESKKIFSEQQINEIFNKLNTIE